MVRKIIWTEKAKNELFDILEYWNNRNKSKKFSIKLNKLFEEQLGLIAKFPNIARKTDISNVNIKVVHKYLMYYEILDETVYVLTIRHGSQNPQNLELK